MNNANNYQNMSNEELVALLGNKELELAEMYDKAEKKSKRKPPAPPAPFETYEVNLGGEEYSDPDGFPNVVCIKEEDFKEFVEGQDKAGLKETIGRLVEDLKALGAVCDIEEPVIKFYEDMVRGKKRGARKECVLPTEERCECAIKGGHRCSFKEIITLECGRKVCKAHKKITEECIKCFGGETDGSSGGYYAWYDDFNDDKKKLKRKNRKGKKGEEEEE